MNNFLFENKTILDSVGRCTSFTVVYWCQYPEDIDKDRSFLFKFLSFCGVPCVCSPVHDLDINELDSSTGVIEFKKPHFHIAFDFGSGNNKTVKQCFELIEPIREFISIAPFDRLTSLNEFNFLDQEFEIFDSKPDLDHDPFIRCCKVWKKGNVVRNMRSLLRYFCHLDNPEKHQYNSSDFHTFNGFNLEDRLYSQSDSLILLDEILDFVEREEVYSFLAASFLLSKK